MAVQENAFNILWDTLKEYISIERLVEAMTIMPRVIFGLETQEITKGHKAVMTIFTTSGNNTLAKKEVRSASHNNPFIGKKLGGKVLGIINNDQFHLNK